MRGPLVAATATAAAGGWQVTALGAVTSLHSVAYVAVLVSALWVTHSLSQAPAGRLMDRFGARGGGTVALVGMIVCNALQLIAPSLWLALPLQFAKGIFTGTATVSAATRAAASGPVGQGIAGGGISAGAALAIAVGVPLESLVGWRAPFVGGLAIALLALAARGPSSVTTPPSPGGFVWRRALLSPAVTLGTCIVTSFALGTWIAVLLRNSGEFGHTSAALVGALVVAGGAITRPLGGWLAERGDGDRLVRWSLAAIAVASVAIVAVPERVVIACALAVLGLAAGLPFGAVVQRGARAVPDRPAAAIGLVGSLGAGAGAIAVPLLGLATGSAASARLSFGALGALALLATALSGKRP